MGTSYQTYIGPYIRCQVERVPITYEKADVCTDESCKCYARDVTVWAPADNDEGIRFCTACGKKLGTITVADEGQNVPLEKVEGEDLELRPRLDRPHGDCIWDTFYGQDAHVWFPVETDLEVGEFESRQDGHWQAIDPGCAAREILNVESEYSGDIEELKALYGAGNVTVEWGLFSWAN